MSRRLGEPRHGDRRVQGLSAQLPGPAQARPARHKGGDRNDPSAPGRPQERAARDAVEKAEESIVLLNRTVLTILQQAGPGRAAVRLCDRPGHRRGDPRSARPDARQTQRAPARADQERRHLHGRRRRRRGPAPRPSRRWLWPSASRLASHPTAAYPPSGAVPGRCEPNRRTLLGNRRQKPWLVV